MDGRDPETNGHKTIVDLLRRRSKRGQQETNTARIHGEMEETHETVVEPTQETKPEVGVQDDVEVKPAPPHRANSIENVKVKNVEEVKYPAHEEEQER